MNIKGRLADVLLRLLIWLLALVGDRRSPEEKQALTDRLDALLAQLRDRLSPEDYQWASENSGETEWELAIVTVREAVQRGELTMTTDEDRELAAIESKTDERLVRQLLGDG